MRRLRHFHQQARRRRLSHHHVNRLVSVNPVRHSQYQSAQLEHLACLGKIFTHQVRHRHFTPVNRNPHRRNRAQKRRRRQNKHQQRHPPQPFQSLSKSHTLKSRFSPSIRQPFLAPKSPAWCPPL